MDDVGNNLRKIWIDEEVRQHRVITPNEVSMAIGIRPDTIQGWLKCRVTRLDARVMTALATYFDVQRVVYDVKENHLTFERNSNE